MNNTEKIKQKIEKLQEQLKLAEAKEQAEKNKVSTIKIKELKIEVETQIHHKGEMLKEIIIPKGWRLLTANEIIFLFNNYKQELNLENTWEFIEQPFNLNKENDYVAGFYADSDWAGLSCYWDPDYLLAKLGVRFCRSLK